MNEFEQKARNMIEKLSDSELLTQWALTNELKNSEELAVIRGWLKAELDKRFPNGFKKWGFPSSFNKRAVEFYADMAKTVRVWLHEDRKEDE